MIYDVFAALYTSNLKLWHGDDYMASFLTAVGLCGAVGMNVLLLVGIVTAVWNVRLGGPPWAYMLVPFALLVLGYLLFVHSRRFEKHTQEFEARSLVVQRRVRVTAWTYVALSYSLPIFFALFMAAKRP